LNASNRRSAPRRTMISSADCRLFFIPVRGVEPLTIVPCRSPANRNGRAPSVARAPSTVRTCRMPRAADLIPAIDAKGAGIDTKKWDARGGDSGARGMTRECALRSYVRKGS
jgi:hypothetical protein